MDALHICRLRDRPECLERVAGWHHQVWLEEQRARFGQLDEKVISESFSKRCKMLRSHLSDDAIPETFLAELDGEVVGSASVVTYQFLSEQARSEWLTNVYVVPDFRCRGIAAKLIDHSCHYAAEQGVAELKLYTSERTAYYRKLGWQGRGSGQVQGHRVDILCQRCAK